MTSSENKARVLALPGNQSDSLGWAIATLTWSGYRVDRAESAAVALRALQSASYDVLLIGYDSGSEDLQLCVDLAQCSGARLPTIILLNHQGELVPPPQLHFAPCGFLEPGFTSAELLQLVEKLRLYHR